MKFAVAVISFKKFGIAVICFNRLGIAIICAMKFGIAVLYLIKFGAAVIYKYTRTSICFTKTGTVRVIRYSGQFTSVVFIFLDRFW
jgi:hypothetical protein